MYDYTAHEEYFFLSMNVDALKLQRRNSFEKLSIM